jgi:hypothetical protein
MLAEPIILLAAVVGFAVCVVKSRKRNDWLRDQDTKIEEPFYVASQACTVELANDEAKK